VVIFSFFLNFLLQFFFLFFLHSLLPVVPFFIEVDSFFPSVLHGLNGLLKWTLLIAIIGERAAESE